MVDLARTNGWTGGQYSLFRIALGLYLTVHFTYLTPWAAEVFSRAGMLPDATLSPLTQAFPNILRFVDQPAFVTLFTASGAVAAVLLALGRFDRAAALWCWYVLACLFGRNPLIQNPSLPYTGWMLLMHVAVPVAPFGSLAARNRADPANGWALPAPLFFAAWVVLTVSYSYSGWTKLFSPSWVAGDTVREVLDNPLARDGLLRDVIVALPPTVLKVVTWSILYLELLFAPLALSRRLRPWIWFGMLVVQVGFAALLRFPDLTVAMLIFHLITFDPAWLKGRSLKGGMVFYDGTCVLCHRTVRLLIAEDVRAELTFAPLDGLTSTARLPPRDTFPVSMLVVTADGHVHAEDRAVLYLFEGLGGLWRALAVAARACPASLRRRAYRAIGDNRHRLFGMTAMTCPRLPESLRGRVLP